MNLVVWVEGNGVVWVIVYCWLCVGWLLVFVCRVG